LRPADPHEEKQEIYECGEPTIGSSFVQFDLRFYVVALVFIIFDVEVAFLFPWATVFGKSTNLMRMTDSPGAVVRESQSEIMLTADAEKLYREMGVRSPTVAASSDAAEASDRIVRGSSELARLAVCAVMFFFIVLLIGFAYEWKTGALDWVRAISHERSVASTPHIPTTAVGREPVLQV
jgi:NADH-quinone oxidoreductase subunit A